MTAFSDVPTNAVKMRDAVAIAGVVRSVRGRMALPPIGDTSWSATGDGEWGMCLSESASLMYYQDPTDPRVELVVDDWCYGEVRGASIARVDGRPSLILGMDDGTYVSVPVATEGRCPR